MACQRAPEYVAHECGLARAADAGDDVENAEGDAHVDVFEVVLARALDVDIRAGLAAAGGDGNAVASGEEVGGVAVLCFGQTAVRALVDDGATEASGVLAYVDDVVGMAHDVLVVLDNDDGVADFLQAAQHAYEFFGVA